MAVTNLNLTLELYNEEFRQQYNGAVALLLILMVLGIVGNLHVLYVYTCRMKNSNHRVFILTIAILDTVLCFSGIPFILVTMFMPLTFSYEVACKVMRFIIYFCAGTSVNVLMLIAINRYLKTCRPCGRQITPPVALRLCAGAFALGVGSFWSALVLYGKYTSTPPKSDIVGTGCDIDDKYIQTTYPTAWNLCMSTAVILYLILMILMYTKIGKVITQPLKLSSHSEKNVSGKSASSEANKESTDVFTHETGSQIDSKDGREHESAASKALKLFKDKFAEDSRNKQKKGILYSHKQFPATAEKAGKEVQEKLVDTRQPAQNVQCCNRRLSQNCRIKIQGSAQEMTAADYSTVDDDDSKYDIVETKSNTKSKSDKKASKAAHELKKLERAKKITLMFFVLTAVYFVTFIPHLAMQLALFTDVTLVHNLSFSLKVLYHIVYNFAFINSAVNCYVYNFYDAVFRQELKKMYGLAK